MEDLVRRANNVEAARETAFRESLGAGQSALASGCTISLPGVQNLLEDSAEDVAHATSDDIVEPHHVARVLDPLPRGDVPARHNGREPEPDESQCSVPPVSAVVGGEDHLLLVAWRSEWELTYPDAMPAEMIPPV